MNDKTVDRLVTVLSILIGIWLAVGYGRRSQITSSAPSTPASAVPIDPNLVDYMNNFGGSALPFAQPNINVNVGNQSMQWLNSNYIPLFGFVGMAQGHTYQ